MVSVRSAGFQSATDAARDGCVTFEFPIVHIADWQDGAYVSSKDPALLMTLREAGMVLVGFDRASMAKHAGILTREALGHAGVILFRRSVPPMACDRQATLLVNLWRAGKNWDWADRIVYLHLESNLSA